MGTYKHTIVVTLAILTCLCLYSCKEEKDLTQPPVQYTESDTSVPDEFVYPGESTAQGISNAVTQEEKDRERANKVVSDISDYVDLTNYQEPVSAYDDGYSLYYTALQEAKNGSLPEFLFTLGTEKVSVKLPADITALLDAGFTVMGDVNGETSVDGGGTVLVTMCTPETSEIFGFSAQNDKDTPQTVSELGLGTLTLTSFNNYTAFGALSGTSDIKAVTQILGAPHFMVITAAADECSVMLEYSSDKGTVLVLADGDTGGLIALNVTGK